ncbi:MAG: HAMP domain-containing sensor histidine kinase [Thermodesulfobacteriota bacterium]
MQKLRIAALAVMVVAIGLAHLLTPGQYHFFHDTFRRLSYFPIVLAAIWFGLRGGLTVAVLSSVAFTPHLALFLARDPGASLSELTEVLLYLAAGTVTGFIAGREARLRRQYQEASQNLERSYARLHDQAQLLLEAEEQLGASQRLSALGQLAATLAHEIKNPLAAIRGAAEILREDLPAGHPKEEFADILLKEVNRLNATVEEVLRYSRGVPSRSTPWEPLRPVVERVVTLVEGQRRKKAVQLTVAGLTEAGDRPVDGGRLTQVLLNLVINAIEVVPAAGGRVEIRVAADPDALELAIRDNGPGVPAQDRQRIFMPFVSNKEGGTGLGLSLSRKLVEGLGGQLLCGEGPEGGALFTIRLPVPGSPAGTPPSPETLP